jgi:hypothetical protein
LAAAPLVFASHSGFVESLSYFDMWAPFFIVGEL